MTPTLDPELLKILCCPETHQTLTEANAEVVERVNREIAAGELKNRADQTVTEPLSGGLIREDQQVLYPIRNGIPVLLIDEALPLKP